jgi:AcrR family transcriptional regulator
MIREPVVLETGLRGRNALQARMAIVDAAFDLFERHGYEATTLLDVATHAGVSVSTLHRYFGTKDSLIVDHPRLYVGGLADLVRQRAHLPVDAALEEAVLAYLDMADVGRSFLRRLRDYAEDVPSVLAKVGDYWQRETEMLLVAVGERMTPADGPYRADLLARNAVMLVSLALEHARRQPERSAGEIGRELVRVV